MKLDRKIGLLTAATIVAVAGNALAQSSPLSEQPSWRPLSGFGMTLAGGGGVTDFTQSGTRDVTQIGGSWDVRLAFETRRLLGFEVSYVGGANAIHSLGVDSTETKIIRNGIEAMVRLNAPLYARQTLLEPYAAGGAGWNGYRITNMTIATASVSPTNENTFSVPLAIGFVVGEKGFIADLRYTFRPTYKQTMFRDQGSGALTNWDAGGMIGYEF